MKRILLFLSCLFPLLVICQNKDSLDRLLSSRKCCGIGCVDTNVRIRIHCAGTLSAGNEPLIILDGLVVEKGGLSSVDPHSIETISILKDAAATALYGFRAGSGVIIITSKMHSIVIKDSATGQRLSGASVKIRMNLDSIEMAADSNGMIRLSQEQFRAIKQIDVSYAGYQSMSRKRVTIDRDKSMVINLSRKPSILGEVVIVGYPTSCHRCHCYCSTKITRVYPNSKFRFDDAPALVWVYPNPIKSGGQLTVVSSNKIDGTYQVYAITGAVVSNGVANLSAEQPLSINTNNLNAGTYVIRLTDKGTAKSFTQQFIIQ